MSYKYILEVYVGQQPEGPFRVQNNTESLVRRLLVPLARSGRNLTCDNYFASISLINFLVTQKITYVGTIRKNKRELPPEFLNVKLRPITSSIFGYQENITLLLYVPKKNNNVLLVSSLHHDDSIDPTSGDKHKPEMITCYISTKGGIDTVDLLSSNYDVARKTKRWRMEIFFGLMNIAGINAQVIHTAN